MTFEQFHEQYEYVKKHAQNSQDIISWLDIKRNVLPPFYTDHIPKFVGNYLNEGLIFQGYKYTNLQRIPKPPDIEIDPVQCISKTWLFTREYTRGKPDPDKMYSLLEANPANIEPFFAIRLGEYYYCSDGNHRIYAAYLSKRLVKAIYDEEFCTVTPV